MSSEIEVTMWLNQLSEQPDEAMNQIWRAYYEKLVHYARKKLGEMPRRTADEEDVAVNALNSFYQAAKKGRFPNLRDRTDLWKLLLTMTARKAGHEIREQFTQKRGGGAVRGESVFIKANGDEGAGIAMAAEPTQEFGELFVDELMAQLDELGDERLRQIAVLKLEGYTNEEIAQELSVAVRTIERKLNRIRLAWGENH